MESKYYKLTLARIGKQENWAGWKIAGKSENTPSQIMESFESFHGSKNHVVSYLNKPVEMYEVSEYRGNLFVSQIRFGIKDMLGRPSFSVKGIVFPISDNSDIYLHPERFLSLSEDDFSFSLKKLYGENRALKQEYVTGNNVITIHDNELSFSRDLSLDKIITKYFSDEQKLECFIRSILWAGNNNQTTLCIKVPKGFIEYFEIMYLVYSVLPLSMRSRFSFRTYNLRNLSGAKITFDEGTPNGKYYDLSSGNNNVFLDSNVLANSRKLSFIKYIIENIHSSSSSDYFEALQDSLESVGQANSTDLNTIELAHNMLLSSDDESDSELTDIEILKKFQEYVSLDYTNEVIDENIVKYLSLIIQKGIPLNETLMNRLESKLKSTKYDPLIELGYDYKATKLLEATDKQKSFEFLLSIENDVETYNKYIKAILGFVKGPSFLDEYYGVFYADRCVKNIDDLCAFYEKTKQLPERIIINKRIYETAYRFSMKCVELMLEKHIEFDYHKHISLLNDKLGLSSSSRAITDEMKKCYWNEFDFCKFDFNRIVDYLTYLPYENWQFNLIKGINAIVDELSSQKPETIKRFNSYIRGQIIRGVNLSLDEQDFLRKEFQRYCLIHSNKSYSLDYWLEVAKLFSIQQYIRFIFHNRITVFTDPDVFESEFLMSRLYENRTLDDGSMIMFKSFCDRFLDYIDKHGQYDEVGRVLVKILNNDRNIHSSSKYDREVETENECQESKTDTGIRGLINKSKEGFKGILPGKKKKHMKNGKHGQ